MPVPVVPMLAMAMLASLCIYRYIVEPAFLSKLSKIPNAHWSAPLSPLWILSERRRSQETFAVHRAHQRHGPIVRLAPNEISVNSVDGGIRTIYGGGYEKGDWYSNVFNNYDREPMFSMSEHGPHSRRKRMLSNIYAKSTLHSSPAMASICEVSLQGRLTARLKKLAESGKPAEFFTLFQAATLDIVAAYVFGMKNACDFVDSPDLGRAFFEDYKARQRFEFWPQDVPIFTKFMGRIGLRWLIVPRWVSSCNEKIEAWVMSMCDKAEETVRQIELQGDGGLRAEDWPTVYAQLRKALINESTKRAMALEGTDEIVQENRFTIASEMLDHTLAGFDTSSIVLAFHAWELSQPKNAEWQRRLRDELSTLRGSMDAKTIDALPVLHATLMETLRLHASIPGNQPRITPPSATLGTEDRVYELPPGVRVQAQAWSLHREPTVFPDPEMWHPSRWLDSSEEQTKEMARWFWAFSSGGRMCVGSNLAMLDMKAIITTIWRQFETELVDGEGMVHRGGYVAGPTGKGGKFVVLRLHEDAV